jgi:hypothetical protein
MHHLQPHGARRGFRDLHDALWAGGALGLGVAPAFQVRHGFNHLRRHAAALGCRPEKRLELGAGDALGPGHGLRLAHDDESLRLNHEASAGLDQFARNVVARHADPGHAVLRNEVLGSAGLPHRRQGQEKEDREFHPAIHQCIPPCGGFSRWSAPSA